ncbi:hypothetical protein LINPERHAP1_LOCUS13445 [Linum perenne]
MARIDDGERRLYQCARKYDQIVNQSSKGANNAVPHVSSYEAGNDGKVFVETITKFLQELSDEPAVDSSSATRDYPE